MSTATAKRPKRTKPAAQAQNADTLMRPIGSIRPYPNNPRKNDQAVAAVAKSIQEFGFRQPIVVDNDGVIIVGHTRYKAAIRLGLDEVPVHVADLPPEKANAYRLADNATNELATWDADLLPIELANLQAAGIDVAGLGFAPNELEKYLRNTANPAGDPNFVPEPPAKARTKRGNVWILGPHRLMCGDSGDAAELDRLLDGNRIHLLHTDPPYNVDVQPRSNNAMDAGLSSFKGTRAARAANAEDKPRQMRPKDRPIANDKHGAADFDRLLDAWFGNAARVLEPGRSFYVWGGYANCGIYPPFLKKHSLHFAQAIIWVKEHPVMSRKDFMGNHEWCFYGWKEGAAHVFFGQANVPDTWRLRRGQNGAVALGKGIRVETAAGSRLDLLPPQNARSLRRVPVTDELTIITEAEPTDVWSIKKVPSAAMVHLKEKPVELAERAMNYSSRKRENVLDLFGGSGSTLIAAEQTERRAFLMELDPLYCDVIVQRWETFTKRKAVRA